MEIFCPKCQKKYVVADSLAGKQARCKNPSCGQVFTVAARAASSPKPAAPVGVAKPAAAAPAKSSLFDELPPMSTDNVPQAGGPSVLASNYRPSRAKGSHKSRNVLFLLLGGGIAAVLVVVGLVVFLTSSSGGSSGGAGKVASVPSAPPWSAYDYIPENANKVAYVNFDELRKSELYADPNIRKFVDEQLRQLKSELTADDIGEFVAAGLGSGSNDETIVSLRTRQDRPLKDLLPNDRRAEATKTHQNVEYAAAGKSAGGKGGFLAKTGERAYCGAPTEELLKRTIERLARRERAKLAPNLQSALNSVAGSPLYLAGITAEDPRMPFAAKYKVDRFFGRVSLTSSVRIDLTVVFADANQATECKKQIDQGIGMLRMVSSMAPADKKKVFEAIISAINIRLNGSEMNCEATWQNQDILAFVKMAKEGGGMMPMAPGMPPAGMPPGAPGGMPPGGFPMGPPGGAPAVPNPPHP